MTTYRLCKYCGDLHDVAAWPENHMEPPPARSDLGAPMLIGDEMPPTQSMVDGKFYTSKAAMRATYMPSGNKEGKRYTEVGNDRSVTQPKPYKPALPDRNAIRASIGRAFSRAGLGA